MDRIGLIGHSRGGEAVVSTYDRNKSLPQPARAKIGAVVSIAPTDFRHISVDVPYLAIIGSDDGDVRDGSGIRIYDRATAPKQMLWVIGAIHNFFSSVWQWQDEVPGEPPVNRLQHQDIAKAYCGLFLRQYLCNMPTLRPFFTGDRSVSSLSGVEIHHAYQAQGGLLVDGFEEAGHDKTHNSLTQPVSGSNLVSFDEESLQHFGGGASSATSCPVNQPSWFQDTNGLMVEWNNGAGVYTTNLGNRSVVAFPVLSFRVGQDATVNPAGQAQDFRVRLTDSRGATAVVKASDYGRIPYPRTKSVGPPGTTSMTMSVLKTVRVPLARFTAVNSRLDLTSLASLSFEFSERSPGRLAIDDIEFSQ